MTNPNCSGLNHPEFTFGIYANISEVISTIEKNTFSSEYKF